MERPDDFLEKSVIVISAAPLADVHYVLTATSAVSVTVG